MPLSISVKFLFHSLYIHAVRAPPLPSTNSFIPPATRWSSPVLLYGFVIAARSGADLIKLFPAGVMGPGYLKDLKGPLPALDVMPTGGIRLDDVPAWLAAGALAVGLGGPMLGDAVEGGSLNALRRRHAWKGRGFALESAKNRRFDLMPSSDCRAMPACH